MQGIVTPGFFEHFSSEQRRASGWFSAKSERRIQRRTPGEAQRKGEEDERYEFQEIRLQDNHGGVFSRIPLQS